LGVRAVIAQSYERIHRSNLIGMGVLPLQYKDGDSAESLGLSGEESFDIGGLAGDQALPNEVCVRITDGQGKVREFAALVRIDTPVEADYYRHGGILPYMLRQLLAAETSQS
jgi:aconitate hydratase